MPGTLEARYQGLGVLKPSDWNRQMDFATQKTEDFSGRLTS
jgi:hypothetical protein